MKRPAAAMGAAVIGSAAAAYLLVVRPWQLRWGAIDEEHDATLAGDDLIPNPIWWQPVPSLCMPRPTRSGPGSPSSGRAGAASIATTRWRTWSARHPQRRPHRA
jgi:hypothetical protein